MTVAWSTIRQEIPALHALPEAEPPRIDTGQNAWVWHADPYIVRVPRHEERPTPAPPTTTTTAATTSTYHREAAILQVVAPYLPLPIPDMEVHDLADGTPVAIHRALPGQPLLVMPEEHAAAFATTLGTFLLALHCVPLPELDGLAIPVANRGFWRSWLRDAIARLAPHLDAAATQRLGEAGEGFLDEIAQVSPVLIHGDFGGSNILAADDAITGIIDFGGVQIGDPASDLAGLVASYGSTFLDHLETFAPAIGAMRSRIAFYRLAFAAMEALHGLDHGDEPAFHAGIASLASPASPVHPPEENDRLRQT